MYEHAEKLNDKLFSVMGDQLPFNTSWEVTAQGENKAAFQLFLQCKPKAALGEGRRAVMA